VRRLYLQIYLGFLAILVLIVVAAGVLGALLRDAEGPRMAWATGFASILAEDLAPDRSAADLHATLERRAETMQLDLALWDARGHPVASTGPPWPDAPAEWGESRRRIGPPHLTVRLEDGRWFGMRIRHTGARHLGFFGALLCVGLVVAAGAYPVARRLTKRLEETRRGVEAFGAGDLATRVQVRGRDEIAALAESFNAAAERVESLVASERRLIANASHELRSPLARLRVALHLMRPAEGGDRFLEEAERDIDELDALVGDLLLGSRLEAQRGHSADPELDLRALVEEVCEREGVPVRCVDARLRGDAKALARMLRNLIDNARQHGGGAEQVALTRDGARLLLRVLDRGPGVGNTDPERVFEAFYRGNGAGETSGAGLGLALVRQIARYHRGDARLFRREGGGCVAEVELAAEERA
jgi:signal transduction histidine kinase